MGGGGGQGPLGPPGSAPGLETALDPPLQCPTGVVGSILLLPFSTLFRVAFLNFIYLIIDQLSTKEWMGRGEVNLCFVLCSNYWSVRKLEDAAMLAVCVGLLYACLEAPHSVWDHRSFSRFFFRTVHKMAVVFVMSMALHHFKNY